MAACHELERVLEADYDSRYQIGFTNKATVTLCSASGGLDPRVIFVSRKCTAR